MVDSYLTIEDIRNATRKGLADGLAIAAEMLEIQHTTGLTNEQMIKAIRKSSDDMRSKITDKKLREMKP